MADVSIISGSFSSTSTSLIALAKRRDGAAWERLVRLYSPLIYYWCRSGRMNSDDAADVVQDVLRAVAGGLARFDHESEGATFRGWLRTITQNKLRTFLQKRRTTPQAPGGSDAYQHLAAIADHLTDEDEISRPNDAVLLCQRALALVQQEFEPKSWKVFTRVTLDNVAPSDVANELGVSVGSVYKVKSRVLARLREHLADLL